MKVLKRAEQKNVILSNSSYTKREISNLIEKGLVWYIYNGEICYNPTHPFEYPNDIYRISLSDCKEIKVVYNSEIGYYENVVITKNDEILYIDLV